MEYTEYEPGRFGCPDCGMPAPAPGDHDRHPHAVWCTNPENPNA